MPRSRSIPYLSPPSAAARRSARCSTTLPYRRPVVTSPATAQTISVKTIVATSTNGRIAPSSRWTSPWSLGVRMPGIYVTSKVTEPHGPPLAEKNAISWLPSAHVSEEPWSRPSRVTVQLVALVAVIVRDGGLLAPPLLYLISNPWQYVFVVAVTTT